MAGRMRGALASSVAGSPVWAPRTRARLLKALGVRVHGSARVYPWIRFVGGVDHLEIGRGAFVNVNATIGANARIVIGDRVHLGPGVSLLPTSHEVGPREQRAGTPGSAPITIGAGAWLGAGVTVLGGVTIGEGCVIAAGSLVSADTQPDGVYGGVPARLIRRLGPSGSEPAPSRAEPTPSTAE
ncbi:MULTISPECIES: acyltransferase [unclassified Modestobacter]|uniref:acyltransferase n=1 Tax=unclassified Modestobacter TaxID=2643866 RepID=UPI0022AA1D37|nr:MULTISPECIES: DapH/DapD/GlmU-related protein [unclassified Modestobacter]MCZ2825589.1 DapH/DapD/GlmU-related protein [Modestobacter sp. VKM Ac-2981]MCZ2853346.1 DapH/DapD/GlmU-related protein [Modestobacter sp. VKM Ac-2982]